MDDTATQNTDLLGGADAPPSCSEEPIEENHSGESHDRAGSWLLAPLRWLRRKLSGAARWVAKLLRGPIRRAVRIPLWLLTRSPFRQLLGGLVGPKSERGFGFWWMIATIAIAGTLGLIVAAVLTPVAGIVAMLVVGIWAMVSRLSGRRAESQEQERGPEQERGQDADPSADASDTDVPAGARGRLPIATAPATG